MQAEKVELHGHNSCFSHYGKPFQEKIFQGLLMDREWASQMYEVMLPEMVAAQFGDLTPPMTTEDNFVYVPNGAEHARDGEVEGGGLRCGETRAGGGPNRIGATQPTRRGGGGGA